MDITLGGNRFTALVRHYWSRWTISILIVSGTAFLLLWRLGSNVPVLSNDELIFTDSTRSIHQLIGDPTNAPLRAADYALRLAHISSILSFRFMSTLFAAAGVLCFFLLMRRWHTRRMSFLGTILLIGSSWYLVVARSATPDILLFTMPLLLLYTHHLVFRKKPKALPMAFLLNTACIVAALYVPYMLWLILVIKLAHTHQVLDVMRRLPKSIIALSGLMLVVGLIPLAYSSFHDPHILLRLGGIPESLLPLKQYAINAKEILGSLGIRSVASPTWRLGRLPLLDAVAAILLVLGLYYYWLRRRSHTTIMLLILGVASVIVLVLLPNAASGSLALLIFPSYIAITAGATMLLQQWFTIFPRNNIARNIGTGLLGLLVILSVFYHFQRYFVAWPQSPATKQAFSISSH